MISTLESVGQHYCRWIQDLLIRIQGLPNTDYLTLLEQHNGIRR